MTNSSDRTPREGDRVEVTYATGNEDRTHEGTLVEKFDGGLRVDVDTEYADDPEALVIEGIKVVNETTSNATSVLGGLKEIEVVEDADAGEEGGEVEEEHKSEPTTTDMDKSGGEWVREVERRRARVGMSQKELSRRAGFEVARLSTIKARGHSPTEETREAFESVLEEAEAKEVAV